MPNLAEKYKPERIEDFVGLEKPKQILSKFAQNPYPSNWLFVGPSGTGKTSMALALAFQIRGAVIHIPSQECTVSQLREVKERCTYRPNRWIAGMTLSPDSHRMEEDCEFWFVLVDEADKMRGEAKLALLSMLDGTATPKRTIFAFTCNSTDGLDDDYRRFLSRVHRVEFSTYGLLNAATPWLESIWKTEAPTTNVPNLSQWMKESRNNLRDVLNKMEVELLSAENQPKS